jgi:(E)-4-hydroxy-3-methylbut-2-enyl-diphosphate synthase
MFTRDNTKRIEFDGVTVGAGAPVRVESMTKTDTRDAPVTLGQIERLTDAGCEIVRVAVPDMDAAAAFGEIVAGSPIPVVADIHFDYRLALAVLETDVASVRLNPGNVRKREHLQTVAGKVKEKGIPVRVGVNAGSIDPAVLERHGERNGAALAESAVNTVRVLEDFGLEDFIISAKSTDVFVNLEANRKIAEELPYPLHIGVTEAGFGTSGVVRSALGIGMILAEGIGDTIRVSLTEDPTYEVEVGYEILRASGVRRRGPTIISCPTCGRLEVDLMSLARSVAETVKTMDRDVTIAVMGCAVNGPGEASEADVGIAGGKGRGIVYRRGEPVRSVPEEELLDALLEELAALG